MYTNLFACICPLSILFSILLSFHYSFFFFFFNDTATTEIYTLSYTTLFRSTSRYWPARGSRSPAPRRAPASRSRRWRSEEHTSELQSRQYLVCRLLLEKKKK